MGHQFPAQLPRMETPQSPRSISQIVAWRAHLEAKGIAIEADFEWPGGGRSIYFRDPAGNAIEFAEPRIWGIK